jgi:hypothetical protein
MAAPVVVQSRANNHPSRALPLAGVEPRPTWARTDNEARRIVKAIAKLRIPCYMAINERRLTRYK